MKKIHFFAALMILVSLVIGLAGCEHPAGYGPGEKFPGFYVSAMDYYDHSNYIITDPLSNGPTSFRITHTAGTPNSISLEYNDGSSWVTVGAVTTTDLGIEDTATPYVCIIGKAGGTYTYTEVEIGSTITHTGSSDGDKFVVDEGNSWSGGVSTITYDTDSFDMAVSADGDGSGSGWAASPNVGSSDYVYPDPSANWTISWSMAEISDGWAGINITYDDASWTSINFVCESYAP